MQQTTYSVSFDRALSTVKVSYIYFSLFCRKVSNFFPFNKTFGIISVRSS